MATALSGSMNFNVDATYTNTTAEGSVITDRVEKKDSQLNFAFSDGVTAAKADQLYHTQISLAAAGTSTLDLESATNAFGTSLDFAKIKGIQINSEALKDSGVNVGAAVANPWLGWIVAADDLINCAPGGTIGAIAPELAAWAVSSSNSDLKFAHDGAGSETILVDVYIIGTSA
mgnify:CR=1 FL=1|jgi:hypothetical protein